MADRIEINIVTGETRVVPLTQEEIDAAAIAAAAEVAKPFTIRKITIVDRMTDAELTTFEARIAAANVRIRMRWSNLNSIESDSNVYTALSAALTQAFSAQRAAAILARE